MRASMNLFLSLAPLEEMWLGEKKVLNRWDQQSLK